jgi:hypothetical protein
MEEEHFSKQMLEAHRALDLYWQCNTQQTPTVRELKFTIYSVINAKSSIIFLNQVTTTRTTSGNVLTF